MHGKKAVIGAQGLLRQEDLCTPQKYFAHYIVLFQQLEQIAPDMEIAVEAEPELVNPVLAFRRLVMERASRTFDIALARLAFVFTSPVLAWWKERRDKPEFRAHPETAASAPLEMCERLVDIARYMHVTPDTSDAAMAEPAGAFSAYLAGQVFPSAFDPRSWWAVSRGRTKREEERVSGWRNWCSFCLSRGGVRACGLIARANL
jgi:hypothetical protein